MVKLPPHRYLHENDSGMIRLRRRGWMRGHPAVDVPSLDVPRDVPRPRRLLGSRRVAASALLGGGTASGFIGLHVVHLAGVAAAPVILQFICTLPH